MLLFRVDEQDDVDGRPSVLDPFYSLSPELACRLLEEDPSELGALAVDLDRFRCVFDPDLKMAIEPLHHDVDVSAAVAQAPTDAGT
jgi:hypothetical protein